MNEKFEKEPVAEPEREGDETFGYDPDDVSVEQADTETTVEAPAGTVADGKHVPVVDDATLSYGGEVGNEKRGVIHEWREEQVKKMQGTIFVLESFQDREEAGEPKYDGTIRALAEALRQKLEGRGIGQAIVVGVKGGPPVVKNQRVYTLEAMRDANRLIKLLDEKGHADEAKELQLAVDEWARPSDSDGKMSKAA